MGLLDRLLYYPPLIIDDDKNENFTKGLRTYSHQKTKFDESKLGSLEIKDDDEDDATNGDAATHVKKGDVNKNVTRCGAHCVSGFYVIMQQLFILIFKGLRYFYAPRARFRRYLPFIYL